MSLQLPAMRVPFPPAVPVLQRRMILVKGPNVSACPDRGNVPIQKFPPPGGHGSPGLKAIANGAIIAIKLNADFIFKFND